MRKLIYLLSILIAVAVISERSVHAQVLGSQTIFSTQGNVRSSTPDAFPIVSGATLQVQYVSVYVDSGSAATGLKIGIYNSNSSNTHPNTLLASGSIASLAAGWVEAKLNTAISIQSGATYWITVLGSGGNFYYRANTGTTCKNETYSSRQSTLPTTWKTGTTASGCPLSAFATAATSGIDVQLPSAPANLASSVSNGTVALTWTAATDNVGVVLYNVHRSTTSGFTPSASTLISQPTGTSYSDSGLPIGTYYYKVTAQDAAKNVGPASGQATAIVPDAQPPSQPGALTATGAIGTATLAWGAATDNKGVALYNVYRSTASGFIPTTSNRIAQPTGTSYINTGVPAGTYYYLITAQDAAGNIGVQTNEASAIVTSDQSAPSAPGSLTAVVNLSTVNLAWPAATDNVAVTKYNVYRSTTSGFAPSVANRIAQPTGLSYSDANLAAGTYYYLVAAEDAAGNVGLPSIEVSAIVAAQSPTAMLGSKTIFAKQDFDQASLPNAFPIVASTSLQAKYLSVYVDTPNSATSLKVGIYSSDATGAHPSTLLASGSISPLAPGWLEATLTTTASIVAGSKYWITTIGGGGNFYFRLDTTVACTNETYSSTSTTLPATWKTGGSFTGCPLSAFATAVSAATPGLDLQAPTAPSNLAASVAAGAVSLSWTAATDNVGVTQYQVYRSTTSGFTPGTTNLIGQTAGLVYTDSGLGLGTYYYKVIAQDAVPNLSPVSNQATAVISDTQPPSQPGTLSAVGAIGQVTLSWGAATDNVNVVLYNVYRSTSPGFVASPSNLAATPSGTAYTDSNVVTGTYYYQVAARDAAGNIGPVSNEASASATSDTEPPSSPASLTATVNLANVTLSWPAATDNVGVAKYDIYRSTTSGFAPVVGNRIAQSTGLTYSNTNLLAGTYYYLVAAEDAAGNIGLPSIEASAVVVAPPDTQAPSTPTNLSATRVAGGIGLSWTASTDDNGVALYNLHRATTTGFTPTAANRIAQPTDTSFIDSGLTSGNYYYLLTAQDATGNVSPVSLEASSVAGPGPVGAGWLLTFSDEFKGSSYDPLVWAPRYPVGGPFPSQWTNDSGEVECMAPDDVTVSSDALHLIGQKRTYACPDGKSYSYTSGMLASWPSFSQTYGYFEARVKVKAGNGLWPAFWMIPISNAWPPEIDVFELLGNAPSTEYMNLHWLSGGSHLQDSTSWTSTNFSTAYHTFAVDWEPGSMTWYVDGVVRKQLTGTQVPSIPFYMIVQQAIGGWPGAPDSSTPNPAIVDIDYVRAYQKVSTGACYATVPKPTDPIPGKVCP